MNSATCLDEMNEWLLKHDITLYDIELEEQECKCLDDLWNKPQSKYFVWMACHAIGKKDRIAFGVACADRISRFMKDQRSRDALEVCRKYSNGLATDEELKHASSESGLAVNRRDYLSDTRGNAAAECVALVCEDKVSMAACSADLAAYDGSLDFKSEVLWQNTYMRANFNPDWSL